MKRLILIIFLVCGFAGDVHALDMKAETAHGSIRVTSQYRDLSPGEIVKISLESPLFSSAWARFDGRMHAFVPDTGETSFFTLIGLGLDISPGFHNLYIGIRYPDGYEKNFSLKLSISDRTFPAQRLTVDKKFVLISPEVQERVLREKKLVDAVCSVVTPSWLGQGGFIVPSTGVISNNFGEKRIFNDGFLSRHRGIDIKCPRGTNIRASNAGKVVLTGDLYYAGKTVIIDHGAGLFSSYCHLSSILVRDGDKVEKGTTIGHAGSTGRVTGPHLHWGVRLLDKHVNPLSLMHLSFAE